MTPRSPVEGPSRLEDAFEPRRGDLIYGCAEARQAYVRRFPRRVVQAILRHDAWLFADEFNDHYAFTTGVLFASSAPEPVERFVAGKLAEARADGDHRDVRRALTRQRRAYGEVLATTRFAVAELYRTPAEVLARELGPRATEALDGRNPEPLQRTNKMLRRLCKYTLGLVATHPAFTATGTLVHFVLDGLDMAVVAGKRGVALDDPLHDGTVPATSSELRYVYRNRDALRGKVRFYVGGEAVAPPWEEDWARPSLPGIGLAAVTRANLAAWTAYGEARGRKYDGRLPTRSLLGPR